MNLDLTGTVSYEELKHLLSQRVQYRVQAGRFCVTLSLAEAHCMRLALHDQHKIPFIPDVFVWFHFSANG